MAYKYRSIAVSTVMSLAIVFTTVSAPTAAASGSGSAAEGEKTVILNYWIKNLK